MLYPLSYERRLKQYMAVDVLTVRVDGACMTTVVIERRSLILNGLKVLVISVFALHAPTTSGASPKPDELDDPLLFLAADPPVR